MGDIYKAPLKEGSQFINPNRKERRKQEAFFKALAKARRNMINGRSN